MTRNNCHQKSCKSDDDTDKFICMRHGTAGTSLRTMFPYSCYERGILELSGIVEFTGVKITPQIDLVRLLIQL
jgi:hypothetical protein